MLEEPFQKQIFDKLIFLVSYPKWSFYFDFFFLFQHTIQKEFPKKGVAKQKNLKPYNIKEYV